MSYDLKPTYIHVHLYMVYVSDAIVLRYIMLPSIITISDVFYFSGAVIKREVWRQVLRGQAIVRNAADVYAIAENIQGITTLFLSGASVPNFEEQTFPAVTGIKACHQVRKINGTTISIFWNSEDFVPIGDPERILCPAHVPVPQVEPIHGDDEDQISVAELQNIIKRAKK